MITTMSFPASKSVTQSTRREGLICVDLRSHAPTSRSAYHGLLGRWFVANVEPAKENRVTDRQVHDGGSAMYTIALSPHERKVISESGNGPVRLWNIDTGKAIAKWIGHSNWVGSVRWSSDAERVSGSTRVRVWHVKSGQTVVDIKTSGSAARE